MVGSQETNFCWVLDSTAYRPPFRIPVELMASGFTYHMQTHVVFKDFLEFIFPEFKKNYKCGEFWLEKHIFPLKLKKLEKIQNFPLKCKSMKIRQIMKIVN
jgi:hypothetical protein